MWMPVNVTVYFKVKQIFSLFQEPYMEVINPFIRDNQQRMVMFLDELSVSFQLTFQIFNLE